jgi:hypothetical protein
MNEEFKQTFLKKTGQAKPLILSHQGNAVKTTKWYHFVPLG